MSTEAYEIDREHRRVQYAICKVRGHVAGRSWSHFNGPTHHVCRYCGTEFWDETVRHERGAPDENSDRV